MAVTGLAIIGATGVIGKVHADAIERNDNCRLVGVYARSQEPLKQQAKQLGVKPYATLDEALADDEVEGVVIATPHPSHLDLTVRAAEAGKHVLVEKPMSVTVSEADKMIAACKKAGVILDVLFNRRFSPEARKAREIIDSGAVGEVLRASLVSTMMRSQHYYDSLGWRGTWNDEGGGVLINQGIHSMDMFQWLAGMPSSLYAKISAFKHDIEVEDYATALLEYPNGAHGTIHCNTALAPNQSRIEIWGDRGAIVIDNNKVTLHRLETTATEYVRTYGGSAYVPPDNTTEVFEFESEGSGHVPSIRDFADAIQKGRKPYIPGEEGLKPQELVAAMTLSGVRRREVSLPLDRGEYDAVMAELRQMRRLP
jgi:predicted dehydrogenase